MVLRVPAVDRVLVALVQQQPVVLAVLLPPRPDQDERPAQLLAVQPRVQLAGGHRGGGVRVLVRLPRPGVPHDDVAATVPAGGDDPFEVDVVHRVVLDVERGPPHLRVERRPLRHRPAGERPVDLQPEVVVQPRRAVPLHHEPPLARHGSSQARGGVQCLVAPSARRTL
ncbi:hypothetical protein GCM10009827_047570 [Dactylosporangium maewongense]|uniref:Secreted protein n=1 Tax=Dactylosporangium maewongense TaxID=634393 RepID=A0ABN2ARG0_9ACTN